MANRVKYIDALKGFAIIWVVMGHITEKSMGINNTLFNNFYASFHMPVFMFLSGIFAYSLKSNWHYSDFLSFIRKKSLRILMPFIVVGSVYSILFKGDLFSVISGQISSYWFLPALFMCMILGYFTLQINSQLIKNIKFSADIVLFVIIWILFVVLYFSGITKDFPYYVNFIKMYPFFVFGVLFSRHAKIKQFIESPITYFCSIILYILCFNWQEIIPFNFNFIGFPSIIILMQLFRKYEVELPEQLIKVGELSLEIYVFHWFFLPNLLSVGVWFIYPRQNLDVLINQNFILLFILTFCLASIIIFFSKILSVFIKKSKIINFMCFGIIS